MREVRTQGRVAAGAKPGGYASRRATVSDQPIGSSAINGSDARARGVCFASGLRRQTIRSDRFRRGRSRDALCSFEHHQFSVRGSVRYPKALFASALQRWLGELLLMPALGDLLSMWFYLLFTTVVLVGLAVPIIIYAWTHSQEDRYAIELRRERRRRVDTV